MTDVENNANPQEVAPQENSTQNEQVVTTEEVTQAPVAQTDKVDIPEKFQNEDGTADVNKILESNKELESKFTKSRQPEQRPTTEQVPARKATQANPFDNETTQGVENLVAKGIENAKAREFEQKNVKDLKDPMIYGTTARLIQEAGQRGEYLGQEDALSQAKEMLSERIKPATKEATAKGVAEGKEIAKKKEQAQAIGQTGKHADVNPDDLSAEEFAKHHGLT